MKKTLTTYDISTLLCEDNGMWSRAGAYALAQYLEELEEEMGEELELDVVAIRCDFSEYPSLQDWITDYYGEDLETSLYRAGIDLEGDEEQDEIEELIRSHILDHGQLVEFSGGVIVSQF
jgi:hypothetical protein